MKFIQKFIKLYIKKKLKYQLINTAINFLSILLSLILFFILLENNAYFDSIVKQKVFSLFYLLTISFIIFSLLRIIIHRYNILNNSNYNEIAIELIDKIPTKDRIVNALQIYSKIDLNSKYSYLTVNAVNKLEDELKNIDINDIKFEIFKKNIYISITLILAAISLLSINNYYDAFHRLVKKNINFERDIPFSLVLKNSTLDNYFYPNEKLNLIVKADGEAPEKIDFHIKNLNNYKKISSKKNDNYYSLSLNNINKETVVWASYTNEPIFSFNRYEVLTDTFIIKIKKRPEIKILKLIIEPPKYTNLNEISHNQSIKRIEILKGSILNIIAEFDKNIKNIELIFDNDSSVNFKNNSKNTHSKIDINKSFELEFKFSDFKNNYGIPIKYNIIKVDDLNPIANIKFPENDFKIEDQYIIPLEIEVADDYGLNKVKLNYKIIKPYYLAQDTIVYNFNIKQFQNTNKTNSFFTYNWNIKSLNLSPGDEVTYWISAYDYKKDHELNFGISNILRAYVPSLEQMYYEVEEEQKVIEQNFDDILNSVDELKSIYDNVSKDVLKEKIGFEQSQEINNMTEELEQISDKIENLESTIQIIEELNSKNELINDELGDKIEKLQEMFKDMLNSDLMKALEQLQNSLNQDDFKKSLEELNKLNFEIGDLELQLDRMIDLFEQVVAEQKLNELVNKINEMSDFQDKISEKIQHNHNENNINPMINTQKDNLKDFNKNLDEASKLTQNIDQVLSDDINSIIEEQKQNNIKNLLNEISNNKNKNSKANKSSEVKNNLDNIKEELNKIIEQYQKKASIEMLNAFSRIIKNLIDMSYDQEKLTKDSKSIKSKKASMVGNITKKENILMQQYKTVFIQISDLSKKSFHISAETSKTFSQIFNYLSKTIAGLEQGKISEAKKNQYNVMIYINKTILQLISAMDQMQNSGEASGYSQYLESMEQLMSAQQQINQGMNSLLPMPFGQQQTGEGLMQSLMQQQNQLKNQLEQLIDENSTSSTNNQGDGLGKALDDMDKIINDFQNNQFSQESIERGKQVYRRLLQHKNAIQNRGYDDKWEAKEDDKIEWENSKNIDNNKINNEELKKLYKTLDDINNNINISNENKKIIQEYLKILIDEKINEK